MNGSYRLRALDQIKDMGSWKEFNPLFKAHVKIFDRVFERSFPADYRSYVPVMTPGKANQPFEQYLAERLMGKVTGGEHEGKIYYLVADVGRGKTLFCQHLVYDYLRSGHPKVFAVYCDAYQVYQGDKHSDILHALREKILDEIRRRGIYPDECSLFRQLLAIRGYKEKITDPFVLDKADTIRIEEILAHLAMLEQIGHILLVIDNLDECTSVTISEGLSLARQILPGGEKGLLEGKLSILFPLRGYTANRYCDTVRYAQVQLPSPDYAGIFKRKLEECRQRISQGTRRASFAISSATYDPRAKKWGLEGKTYEVTPEGACDFLQQAGERLLDGGDDYETYRLLFDLASGNCKYLVASTYYMLHSCKLPLYPLFRKIFLPPESLEIRDHGFPFAQTIECLLAIHYPFFDVQSSTICNVFNANNSTAPGDYENTLVIPRILIRVLNAGNGIEYARLSDELASFGYHVAYVKAAMKKIMKHGLISSSEGYCHEDFGDTTMLCANDATKLYIERLIFDVSYLQYVCEDVPMPVDLVVPVSEKHARQGVGGSILRRLDSVATFVRFIGSEEEIERESFLKRKRGEDTFLQRFGIVRRERHARISEIMNRETLPIVQRTLEYHRAVQSSR